MESRQENGPKAEKGEVKRRHSTRQNNKRADRKVNQMTALRFQTGVGDIRNATAASLQANTGNMQSQELHVPATNGGNHQSHNLF